MVGEDGESVEEDGLDTPYAKSTFERKVLIQPYDYAVRTLMDMIVERDLILDPDYQRQYRWDDQKASRFVESIALNIPVPVVYMAEEADGKFSVIDGQQRLTSLFRYVRPNEIQDIFPGSDMTPLALTGLKVRSDLDGVGYGGLSASDRAAIGKRPIRCIVVLSESDADLKFEVFERLNSGSSKLSDQEVRNCMFRGSVNNMIKKLSLNPVFVELVALSSADSKQMKGAEMVLRFLAYRALHLGDIQYSRTVDGKESPLSYTEFLNYFMESNRSWTLGRIETVEANFAATVSLISECLGVGVAFRRPSNPLKPEEATFAQNKINGAIFEAQMIAFSILVEDSSGNNFDPAKLRAACFSAFGIDDFWSSLFSGTAQPRKVRDRARVLTDVLRGAAER